MELITANFELPLRISTLKMISLCLQYVTNCPLFTQEGGYSPYATFINETSISLFMPFSEKTVIVSDYENFNISNAEAVNSMPYAKDVSGMCFYNANNGLESSNVHINLDFCNFVEYQFNATNFTRVVTTSSIKKVKNVYYKVDNKVSPVPIVLNISIESSNNYTIPYNERFQVSLPWNVCEIQSSKFITSKKNCNVLEACSIEQPMKLEYMLDGNDVEEEVNYSVINCETGAIAKKSLNVSFKEVVSEEVDKNVYFTVISDNYIEFFGETLISVNGSDNFKVKRGKAYSLVTESGPVTVTISENSKKYIDYTYKEGDTQINIPMKDGEICKFVNKQIFLEAKEKYDKEHNIPDENVTCAEGEEFYNGECVSKGDCAEDEILQDGQCVKKIVCKSDEVLENGVCVKKVICESNQIVQDGQCVDVPVCDEGQKLKDNVCVDGGKAVMSVIGILAGAAALLI